MIVESLANSEVSLAAAPRGGALANRYAKHLLRTLEITHEVDETGFDSGAIDAAGDWAESGLMWLTGAADGPPARALHALPSCARGAAMALSALTDGAHPAAASDAMLLSERSALLGYSRRGAVSANGSCIILAACDGYIALNLAREEDWSLLPAWLECDSTVACKEELATQVALRPVVTLVTRGRLLGLPVAPCGSESDDITSTPPWFKLHNPCSVNRANRPAEIPLVVDLSSLWAGPLCSQLLRGAGARVIKVESSQRPDTTRTGAPDFFSLLHAGKESVVLDLHSGAGRQQLVQMLQRADIVIEGSRPRALQQWGIDAQRMVADYPGKVWISLTGYGRNGPAANWVAFGDDAAIAAGIFTQDATGHPLFCGDAIADPLAGLHAAVAALGLFKTGRGGLLDINLRDVAAHCRDFYCATSHGAVLREASTGEWRLIEAGVQFEIRKPRARQLPAQICGAGADTRSVMREYGIPC